MGIKSFLLSLEKRLSERTRNQFDKPPKGGWSKYNRDTKKLLYPNTPKRKPRRKKRVK